MAAGQNLEKDPGGQWLFRQGDLVLGPLTGQQLVEKLYAGELTADTAIAPPGTRDFRRVGEVEAFRIHVAKAEAKARVDASFRVEHERSQRKRLVIGGTVGFVTLMLAGGAWQMARWAAVHGPGSEDEYEGISVDLPTITLAQSPREDEELIAYPSAGSPGRTPDKPTEARPARPAAAVAARTDRRPPAGRPGAAVADGDGLQVNTQFDQGAINRVVASSQRTLFRCFKEEAERRPGFSAKVPIEFVIGNDGRVAKLWVDHPQLKQGPLYECLISELKKWPFKPYEGERATVGLSFTVGKRG